ncbi:MAG: alpha-amylase/4-alpha-glucanotransferase domain-containing protein [Myxococcota bacterium]
MATIRLQVVIPFHQPLHVTELELEGVCERCYIPIIDQICASQRAKVVLHFTGHILDYFSRQQPELLMRLKTMVKAEQIEILGGLFYGGPPLLLPELDVRGQIEMMAEYWESFIGATPTGMWLPQLAWSRELPRLLDETGLDYGFVSRSQIAGDASDLPPLVSLERGGQTFPAFLIEPDLSRSLPGKPVDAWIESVIAAAGERDGVLMSVWVRAESLGLEPGTAAWCLEQGWLERFLAAVGGQRPEVQTILPRAGFRGARPALPVQLNDGIAPELQPCGPKPGRIDWPEFIASFSEVDTLYRRMLRVSGKLRDTIGTMEEEELEDDWSDVLATAQRLVFSAQSADAYWRGPQPGFSDPVVRDAVVERLATAAIMIDTMVQGDEDWIATEEEDCDADLVDEILVSNRLLSAWIAPARGGLIRSIDDRRAARTVLDVGVRRHEPFFEAMAQAPTITSPTDVGVDTVGQDALRRGESLLRLSGDLPTIADDCEHIGIRELLLDADAVAGEFFSGALESGPATDPVEVLQNAIDEEGNGTYTLETRRRCTLQGVRPRTVTITRTLSVPIDAAEIKLDYNLELEGEGGALLAIEIPVRLGSGPLRLTINDGVVDTIEAEHPDATRVSVQAEDDSAVQLKLEPAQDVWVLPIRTTLRDLEGYRAVDQGVVVVPVVRLEGRGQVSITLILQPPGGSQPTGEASSAGQ